MTPNPTFYPVEMAYDRADAKLGALSWAIHTQNPDEAVSVIDELITRLNALREECHRYKEQTQMPTS